MQDRNYVSNLRRIEDEYHDSLSDWIHFDQEASFSEAEDIVSDTLAKVAKPRYIHIFKRNPERTLHEIALGKLETLRYKNSVEYVESVSQEYTGGVGVGSLRSALQILPDDHRVPVGLYLFGLGTKEISDQTRISLEDVEARIRDGEEILLRKFIPALVELTT